VKERLKGKEPMTGFVINEIPTGYLFFGDYTKGKLETLSIGDYGKEKNVKADFLGYNKPINGVPNGACKPLTEKWVTTLSSQYGCSMNCTFCDVPKIKFNGNVGFEDLKKQLYNAIELFPQIKYTERLNIHFARMGEPIFNENVFLFSKWLSEHKFKLYEDTGLRVEVIHPVLSTSVPKYKKIEQRLIDWCDIKNYYFNGQAGLQLSINSTSEEQRNKMFRGKQLSLEEIAKIGEKFPVPLSRKYTLNFAYASDFIVDASVLRELFDPEKFMVKITPIHNNIACIENNIKTIEGYESYAPYQQVEDELIKVGFDVLVFVPSFDEENGLVTCGNLVLSGSSIKTKSGKLNIEGVSRNERKIER